MGNEASSKGLEANLHIDDAICEADGQKKESYRHN